MYGSNFWMRDLQPARDEQTADGGGGNALPERRDHSPSDEDVAGSWPGFGHAVSLCRLQEDRDGGRRSIGHAALSSSFACRRAAASSRSAPSIRTISPTTSGLAQLGDGRARGLARRVLDDREVAVGQRRDLRQVGDADDLAAGRQLAQLLAHGAGGLTPPMPASTSSKTSVAGPASAAAPISASITRESSPPDAISRSGPAGHAGVGRDQELHLVGAGRARTRARASAGGELGALHGQRAEPLAHGLGQRDARRLAGGAQRAGALARARPGRRPARPRPPRSPPRRPTSSSRRVRHCSA